MDLSGFYKEANSIFLVGVIGVCLLVAGVIYLGIGIAKNKKQKTWVKILSAVALSTVLLVATNVFVFTVIPTKKDLDQKSITYYEGQIEIVEVDYSGWKPLGNLTVRMDGKEYHFLYGRDEQFFTAFEEGNYTGKIVYLRNAKRIMFFKATPVTE